MKGYTLTAASLSGVVYEMTPTGQAVIPGAVVYCERCGEITHTWATADANGFYRFPGRSRHWRRDLAVPRTTDVHKRRRSALRTADVGWAKP